MPFPWKKVKSGRISRLVNDHLHISQKRRDGSSLVVETGFPTSLIDLFIKNREKLKKPSKKKRDVYDQSPVYCPPPPPSPVGSSPPRQSVSPIPPPPIEIRAAAEVVEERGGVESRDRDVDGALLMIFKIFTVVVLGFATKRLALGITISAALLLLLEYAGKRRRGISTAAPPIIRIGSSLLSYKKELPVQEIQVLESPEIQPEKEITEEKPEFQEIEAVEMALKIEEESPLSQKSRKAKITSKIRKIVLIPKKFRGAKKDHRDGIAEESDNGSITSSVSDHGEDVRTSICSMIEVAEAKIDQDKGEDKADSRIYMVLCLIVLAGLIGGRPFALVLTLLWLLVLKVMMWFNVKSS